MNNIKLIALDLDGTLLTSDKVISEKTLNALYRAASMGIEIVPCTGRFYEAMPPCVKNLPFVHYSININGACAFDINNRKTLFRAEMNVETAVKVIEYLETLPVAFDSYLENWGYIEQYFYMNIEDYISVPAYIKSIKDYRYIVNNLKSYLINKNVGIQKVQFFSEDESLIQKGFNDLTELFPECEVTSSGVADCEINDKKATKGNALGYLADYLHTDMKEVMTFGDGGNDVSMIENAGLGVAMGNAKPHIAAKADFVTLGNNEDGVAYALEKFLF